MKVGIYTVFNAYNYGAFLQAYAMQDTLRRLGAQPCFLSQCDIRDAGESAYGGLWLRLRLYLGALSKPRMAMHYFIRNVRLKKAASGLLEKEAEADEKPELIIIGSDELWNIKNKRIGFVPEFYGSGLCCRTAGYAVSCGEELTASDYPAEALRGISDIDIVSVRDFATQRLYRQVTGRDCPVVLDPVFLHDFSNETRRFKPPQFAYMLVYGKITEPGYIGAIKGFAARRGLKTLSVGIYNGWCGKNLAPGPFEFLSLLENADCVVTDTFHGTAFSIIYKKPFTSIVRSAKAADLLQIFGLEGRRCPDPSSLEAVLSCPMDYTEADIILKTQRKISGQFIKEILQRD